MGYCFLFVSLSRIMQKLECCRYLLSEHNCRCWSGLFFGANAVLNSRSLTFGERWHICYNLVHCVIKKYCRLLHNTGYMQTQSLWVWAYNGGILLLLVVFLHLQHEQFLLWMSKQLIPCGKFGFGLCVVDTNGSQFQSAESWHFRGCLLDWDWALWV